MRSVTGFLWLPVGVLALALAAPLSGQDVNPQGEREEVPQYSSLSLFVGASSNFEADESGFAVGTSYRYEIAPGLSIGPVAEASFFTAETSYLLLAALQVTLKDRIEMTAAPGVDIATPKGRDADTETKFAFRLGVGYEVPLKNQFSLTPVVNIDLSGGNTRLVYGARLSIAF